VLRLPLWAASVPELRLRVLLTMSLTTGRRGAVAPGTARRPIRGALTRKSVDDSATTLAANERSANVLAGGRGSPSAGTPSSASWPCRPVSSPAPSLSLAFGLDSLVEVFAGSVVLWRLAGVDGYDRERRALRLISLSSFALAA
jgi:hypothetical protein